MPPVILTKFVGTEGSITEEPIVKTIQKENDMSLVKFAGKEVKVQRQFLNFLEQADDQEKEIQHTEGWNSKS